MYTDIDVCLDTPVDLCSNMYWIQDALGHVSGQLFMHAVRHVSRHWFRHVSGLTLIPSCRLIYPSPIATLLVGHKLKALHASWTVVTLGASTIVTPLAHRVIRVAWFRHAII